MGYTKLFLGKYSAVGGRFALRECAEGQLIGKMTFEAAPITGRETQVQLPKGWSFLMRAIATGRCGNVLLTCLFFLPGLRNASFPQCKGTNYFFFRLLKQMQCVHVCPRPSLCVLELLLLLPCLSYGTFLDKAASCSWGFFNTQGNFCSSSLASFLF